MSFDNGINGDEIIAGNYGTQNGDASEQDDSYSFDESNTDNEEYHDSEDAESGELDFEVDKDRMNEVSPDNN